MVVTSIWPIKGRVDVILKYASNPEKTVESNYINQSELHAVDNVIEYAADEMKTEKRMYVSGIGCNEYNAVERFKTTLNTCGDKGKRVCYHGYQSFKENEVDAETAHEIGKALAENLWGDKYQVLVATHCNTGHYHNHFIIWAAKKQQERTEAFEMLDAATKEAVDNPETFRDYLLMQSRFGKYSVSNALLISYQNNEATYLADFETWKEKGVFVQKGERGITLLEPGNEYTREDGTTGFSINVKKVFDISQTNSERIPIPMDKAVREVENRLLNVETNITNWQRKQNQNNNYSAVVPYDMELQRKESTEFLNDLTTRDQRMMCATIAMAHMADTKEQLDVDTETILSTARRHLCQLAVLKFQQTDGLNTVLPIGCKKIKATRTLTTESLAVFMPFKVQEIFHEHGIYYGQNAISNNMIIANRKCLLNGNSFILGVSGSGKSFTGKCEIANLMLAGNSDIIIIDPEREVRQEVA